MFEQGAYVLPDVNNEEDVNDCFGGTIPVLPPSYTSSRYYRRRRRVGWGYVGTPLAAGTFDIATSPDLLGLFDCSRSAGHHT